MKKKGIRGMTNIETEEIERAIWKVAEELHILNKTNKRRDELNTQLIMGAILQGCNQIGLFVSGAADKAWEHEKLNTKEVREEVVLLHQEIEAALLLRYDEVGE